MSKKPVLDLGPMTGTPEYIRARAESVVETFNIIIGVKLELIDSSNEPDPGARTDCVNYIKAPLQNYDAYLDVTHEISHPLFGTNMLLTQDAITKIVKNRLLRRAGISETSPEGERYAAKLSPVIQMLWNILEDLRCNGLWGELYGAGGALQRENWQNTAQYDITDEVAQKSLVPFLMRYALDVETPDVSDAFERCKVPMREAVNLVEGVDAAACLAITARLVDRIMEELLETIPPDPKEEARAKMNALSKAAGTDAAKKGAPSSGQCGAADLADPPKGTKLTMGDINKVTRLLTARSDDGTDENLSSFDQLLKSGAEAMATTIENARQRMAMPNKTAQDQKRSLLAHACAVAEIPGEHVVPTRPLPSPSETSARVRAYLDRVRMKLKQRMTDVGDDVEVEALLDARFNDELEDAKIFEHKQREAGLELLLLLDLSGSMYGASLTLLERAVADVVGGCGDGQVKVTMWGFSNVLYFFERVGSPVDAEGVSMASTNMVQALEVAHQWAKVSKLQRAIILVTDGFPTSIRAKNSTGDAMQDLHMVMQEIRADNIVLSTLAIGSTESIPIYDSGFGAGTYGLLSDMASLGEALTFMARTLVEAHMKRSMR